jgi:hypothetical protein
MHFALLLLLVQDTRQVTEAVIPKSCAVLTAERSSIDETLVVDRGMKLYGSRNPRDSIVNHPTFAAPNAQATSASFGIINTQANRPRTIQIGARFVF